MKAVRIMQTDRVVIVGGGPVGMVLALMIERNLHVSLTLYGDWFLLTHPIALAMFLFILVTTAMPFVRAWLAKRETAALPSVTERSA